MQKSVVVLFGGRSCENEVSIITGTMAANLLRGGYEVYPVYIAQSGGMFTGDELFSPAAFRGADPAKKFSRAVFADGALFALRGRKLREVCRPACALNCCHGMGGEDGAVSGLLDLNGIPNASPDMAGSAIFMDKALTKLFAKSVGVRTLPYFRLGEAEYAKRGAFALKCVEKLGYPVIVKPNRLGSSIGVTVARTRSELILALECAFAYDSAAIAETYLADRREVNCAALRTGGEIVVSPCEEPKTRNAFLTFKDKYFRRRQGGARRVPRRPAAGDSRKSARLHQTSVPPRRPSRHRARGLPYRRGRGVLQRDEHGARLALVVPVLQKPAAVPAGALRRARTGHKGRAAPRLQAFAKKQRHSDRARRRGRKAAVNAPASVKTARRKNRFVSLFRPAPRAFQRAERGSS